jgi:hypothetical protein
MSTMSSRSAGTTERPGAAVNSGPWDEMRAVHAFGDRSPTERTRARCARHREERRARAPADKQQHGLEAVRIAN